MAKELVFILTVRSELAAINGSALLIGRAVHHVTPELLAALEYTADREEDVEYAALVLVPVAALTRFGGRLVSVADVDTSLIASGDDPENGACILARTTPEVMTCRFSEIPGVDASAATVTVRGPDIDTTWGFDGVRELLHESDLLWNGVKEYRRGSRR